MATATITELPVEVLQLRKAALVYRAINNKLRLQLLHLLHKNGKLTVTSIYQTLRIEQSVASQHLAILRNAGIVCTERNGRTISYFVNYARLEEIHKQTRQLTGAH